MGVEDDDARAEKGAARSAGGAPRSAAERGGARGKQKRLRGGGNVPSHDAETHEPENHRLMTPGTFFFEPGRGAKHRTRRINFRRPAQNVKCATHAVGRQNHNVL